MSKPTSEQWSAYWTRDTVTTPGGMFQDDYDSTIADFWQQVLMGDHDRVIDLACGNGALVLVANDILNRNSTRTVITDADAAVIYPFVTLKKDAKEFPMGEFIGTTPIEALPFDDNSVVIAISQYGLEYPDLRRSIPELGRVLKTWVNTPPAKAGSIGHSADCPLSCRKKVGKSEARSRGSRKQTA